MVNYTAAGNIPIPIFQGKITAHSGTVKLDVMGTHLCMGKSYVTHLILNISQHLHQLAELVAGQVAVQIYST